MVSDNKHLYHTTWNKTFHNNRLQIVPLAWIKATADFRIYMRIIVASDLRKLHSFSLNELNDACLTVHLFPLSSAPSPLRSPFCVWGHFHPQSVWPSNHQCKKCKSQGIRRALKLLNYFSKLVYYPNDLQKKLTLYYVRHIYSIEYLKSALFCLLSHQCCYLNFNLVVEATHRLLSVSKQISSFSPFDPDF